jgi:predicted transcriptional regulator
LNRREPILVQMEILASLFASPKVITRLAQSCNINTGRVRDVVDPLISKGLVRAQSVDGQELLMISEEGYNLYKDWLEIWRRLPIAT